MNTTIDIIFIYTSTLYGIFQLKRHCPVDPKNIFFLNKTFILSTEKRENTKGKGGKEILLKIKQKKN